MRCVSWIFGGVREEEKIVRKIRWDDDERWMGWRERERWVRGG